MLWEKISKGAQHEYDTEQTEATRGGKLNQSDARLGWRKEMDRVWQRRRALSILLANQTKHVRK